MNNPLRYAIFILVRKRGIPMTLEEFTAYVDQVIDNDIPPVLFEGLNLGVIVSPELERSKSEPQLIIMGVYVRNRLGKQVILYYGSFFHLYQNKSESKWKQHILSTIKHELTHHIEALAGQEDLARKEQYEYYLRQQKKNQKK